MWGKKQLSSKEEVAIRKINTLITDLEEAEKSWKEHSPTPVIRVNHLGHAPPEDFFPLIINNVLVDIHQLALKGLGYFVGKMRKSIKLVKNKKRESYRKQMEAIISTLKNKSDQLIASEFSYVHFGNKRTKTYVAHLEEEIGRVKKMVEEKKPKDNLDEQIQRDIAEVHGSTPYQEAQNLHKNLVEEKNRLLAFKELLEQVLAKYRVILDQL